MTDIVFLDKNTSLSDFAAYSLKKTYFVRYYDGFALTEQGSGYMLDILRTDSLGFMDCNSSIIILGENANPLSLPQCSYVIADSSRNEHITLLQKSGLAAVTCGTARTDTISFSSISEEKIIVSLNRSVTALSGKIVQPFEIPMDFFPAKDIYHILCVAALGILLDDFDSDMGKLY